MKLRPSSWWLLVTGMLFVEPMEVAAQRISLDGEWWFAVDSAGRYDAATVNAAARWRKAIVPLSWQAQFADLREYQGVAWYRKETTLAPVGPSERIVLGFEAVDYACSVFVNGTYVGAHEGGYTPFEFEIGQDVVPGRNEILVRVMDPPLSEQGTEGISYWHIPHGKQSWYVQTSGLWRTVWLERTTRDRIKRISIAPEITGKVRVRVHFQEPLAVPKEIHVEVFESSHGRVVAESIVSSAPEGIADVEMNVPNPQLWSPKTPNLYTMRVSLATGETATDRFGFRSFEAKEGKFYLNGAPIYLIGALDQDFYAETIYTTPSEEVLRDEMIKAKQLGLNLLRCHIKVPDRRYLDIADEVGILIWSEPPNWDVFTPEAARRGEETLFAMLDRDSNHPCVVIISIINESWGIDLQKPEQRAWLVSVFDKVKARAPGRLVIDNSACWGNFHLKTDINDYHTYWAIPENRSRFDQTIDEVSQRPRWLFSEFGDSRESRKEPLMISEFGNWGLPLLPKSLPWWFDRDFLGREVTMPAGVLGRFHAFGYDDVFMNYDSLARESQRAQYDALKYEIEALRRRKEIQGYVITEFTDINWEANGLLDIWRNPKIYHRELSAIQDGDVVLPELSRYAVWTGEEVSIIPWISHYGNAPLHDGILRWSTTDGQRGSLRVPSVRRGNVLRTKEIVVKSPAVRGELTVLFQLSDGTGQVLAENSCTVAVFERDVKERAVSIHDPGGRATGASGALKSLGYAVGAAGSSENTLLTPSLDEHVVGELQKGRTIVWFVDTSTSVPDWFPFEILSREAEWYDGNWASSFGWVRHQHPLFRGFVKGPRLGMESSRIAPGVVVTGIPANQFRDVLAGMFVGWIHLNSGFLVQMNAFGGRLIVCTFPVLEGIPDDPFAVSMMDRITEYAWSDWNPLTTITGER